MRVVLDTNVLVSALIKSGKPRELMFKLARKKIQVVTSRNILEEFLKITDDPRIRRYVDEDDTIAFLKAVGSIASMIRVRSRFKVIEEDPDDDMVLRTAHDGRADYIVSGDKHLLSLKEFKGTKTVTVSQMLEILGTGK
ncbi:MAG: putative toxin-antitoxin system toxin component, PIN family [Hadesarchaea archaeon]|nr:putative toxin-antitoxin system toxin component, PIN family [Hadesarchaea archaeon]